MQYSLYFTVFFLLVTAGCSASPAETHAVVPVQTTKAISAQAPQGIALSGILSFAEETSLAAKTGGKIAYLEVAAGSKVRQGDVVARIDTDTVNAEQRSLMQQLSEVAKNKIAVQALYSERKKQAEENIARIQEQSARDIAVQKARISEAHTSERAQAERVGDAAIRLAEAKLSASRSDLSVLRAASQQDADALIVVVSDTIDGLLGITPRYEKANDSFEYALGTLDGRALSNAQEAFRSFLAEQRAYATTHTIEQAITLLERAKDALEKTHTLLLKTESVATFSASTIDTHKTTLLNLIGNLDGILTQLHLSINGGTESASTELLTQQIAATRTEKEAALLAIESKIVVLSKELSQIEASAAANIERAVEAQALLEKEEATKLRELDTTLAAIAGNNAVAATYLAGGVVVSPYDGVVIEKLADTGSVVTSGQTIIRIAQESKMKVVLQIPDSALSTMQIGRPAQVTVDGISKNYTGHISRILPDADPITKKVVLEILIENVSGELKKDQLARVDFPLGDAMGLLVPTSAITQRQGVTGVFVAHDTTAHFTPVAVTREDEALSLIATGLREGDLVITSGHRFLTDGASITITK